MLWFILISWPFAGILFCISVIYLDKGTFKCSDLIKSGIMGYLIIFIFIISFINDTMDFKVMNKIKDKVLFDFRR